MKKAISLFLALMMCLSLCACGTSAAKFQEAYTETYDKIETLNGSCEYVSSLMYDIWNAVGVDYAYDAFVYMLNIPEDFKTYWDNNAPYGGVYAYADIEDRIGKAYGWLHNTTYGICLSSDAEEFHAMCMEFQSKFAAVSLLDEELAEEFKTLRSSYYEDFGIEFDLLYDYYVEVSSFAEFSQNPSGSLRSFGQEIDTYQSEISKLAKAADIY